MKNKYFTKNYFGEYFYRIYSKKRKDYLIINNDKKLTELQVINILKDKENEKTNLLWKG